MLLNGNMTYLFPKQIYRIIQLFHQSRNPGIGTPIRKTPNIWFLGFYVCLEKLQLETWLILLQEQNEVKLTNYDRFLTSDS